MMKKKIKIIDLFSGIGGFSKGFQDAGYEIEKHYFSEIDKHAIAVYKYNFKNAIYAGSVEHIQSGDIERPDVITFGSPCQDFSLAGKRKGMEGQRSSLVLEAIRLISELRPSVFIWENVKGAFSSNNGADFWSILQAFANIGGYRLEWQLLNTVWFLPQNRERIYLVGHLAGRSQPGVFPIGEEINMAKQRSTEVQISSCLAGSGGHIANGEYKGMNIIIDTRQKSADIKSCKSGIRIYNDACPTLNSTMHKDIFKVVTWLTHKDGQPVIQDGSQIRRLTEIECERLQGFTDGWSEYGDYDGVIKKVTGTHRYKMCGNAVTVHVVKEIASRLKIVNTPS